MLQSGIRSAVNLNIQDTGTRWLRTMNVLFSVCCRFSILRQATSKLSGIFAGLFLFFELIMKGITFFITSEQARFASPRSHDYASFCTTLNHCL